MRHALLLFSLLIAFAAHTGERVILEYAPAPADNPLKGLVPYSDADERSFPHSLEFNYLPLAALVVGEKQYDWRALERLLDEIAGRGHQAIVRIYAEYPGKKNCLPKYLLDGGLKIHRYQHTDSTPKADVETPDYGDEKLRACLRDFIAEFGRKYDGDPRLGFLTAGLLGLWGEWHTYPREELFAAKTVQIEVLDAFQSAFKHTPVLLRYPRDDSDAKHAGNARRPFGYHDDSFAWGTLDTGRKGDSWFYMPALKAAGSAALDKWKTQPIGGEIRPEAWGQVFDEKPKNKNIQDFTACVEQTRVTWLMDSGMFDPKHITPERKSRAEKHVRRMGYEFHVRAVTTEIQQGMLHVTLEIENRGVAPFYHSWPAEFSLCTTNGEVRKSIITRGTLRGLLPGAEGCVWKEALDLKGISAGDYQLRLRVPHPLPKAIPIRFANKSQSHQAPYWLTLTNVKLP